MSKPNQNKPNRNSGQRSQHPIQKPDGKQQIETALASADSLPAAASANTLPASANTLSASASTLSSGIQTIAAAYGDYTKKSFEDTKSFVEKLAGVRSFDKAIEVQAEYAKAAFETFVAESQKIRELYSELARQTFKPFAGLAAKATPAAL